MASVFLSYDREDADKAQPIAAALEKAGHSVWWDRHIKGGAQYSNEIEEALKLADAVVVLWSRQSVRSAWVRDEAAVGRDRGRLVPVLIEAVDPPLGFRQYQNIDISTWKGRGNVPRLEEMLASLDGLTGNDRLVESRAFATMPPAPRRLPLARIGALLTAAIILATMAVLLLRDRRTGIVQTVAVAAANPAAEPLARDLLINLGTLRSTQSGSMKLIGRDEGEHRADLIFEIGGDTRSPKPAANLVLMTGKDRTILWSDDFEQKAGGAAELKQQAGFTAARVLGCALEALSPKNGRLRQSLLKPYLNACALLDETFFHDTSQVIPILERVAAEAPRFEPAWAKLLVAETNHFQSLSAAEQKASAGELRRTIAAARQVDPDIPEAYVAEIELLPGGAFYYQVRLSDRAAKAGPDNVFVLAGRSLVMLCVGRLEEAVEDARRAASLDPLSPAIRSSYIQALIYSGHIETARSELAEAERLWPGATTIMDSRYRLNLRYGDATEAADALRLMQSGRVEAGRTREAFVRARLNPTPANIDRAVEFATSAYESQPEIDTTVEVIFTLGEFDRTKELLNFLLALNDASQVPYFVEALFRPPLADLRADPRFIQIADRFGLLSYWQKSGKWPDFCSEPDLPYDCKKEAAKLRASAS
jgi:tetratricopeptide (TPR) repeat protein